jgi:hypothetical protein
VLILLKLHFPQDAEERGLNRIAITSFEFSTIVSLLLVISGEKNAVH